AVPEVRVRVSVLDDGRHALDSLRGNRGLEPRRVEQVAAAEGADSDRGVVPLAHPRLEARMRVDALDDARVQADAGGEREVAPVRAPHVHPAGPPVVAKP